MKKSVLLALLLTGLSLPAWTDTQYELRVDGLACPYCAYGIEKKLKALDGIIEESLEIKLNDGIVRFQASDEATITKSSLKQLINDSGFTLRGLETQIVQQEERRGDE
ncbi:heavy-metal-associated domain-containing protein [Dasania marina]|uniref:heavy-metal-associated domain-containing protein n=1 Tax=Dasania marina TaxID=471499 RepID=UPI0030DADEB8